MFFHSKQNLFSKSIPFLLTISFLTLTACKGGGGGGGGLVSSPPSVGSDPLAGVDDAPPLIEERPPNEVEPRTGSFNVRWTAPVAREDGSPLQMSEIGGFELYYGEVSGGNYEYTNTINDGDQTDVTVTDLPVGIYYVVMTTKDSDQRESRYSSEVMKIVE